MTHRSLSTPNTGLRVFSASVLSTLMIMMPFAQLAAAEKRSEVRAPRSESGRQTAEGRQPDTAKKAAPENVFVNPSLPGPAPLVGPVIVATKDDGLATATTVAPSGTINYSVNIKNNGTTSPTDDATGVTFTDIIDAHTTLVIGSAVAAVSDRYNAIGNVRLSIPDGSTDLLANDIDPDTGNNTGMTVTAETKSSTQCTGGCSNNVTINADGSFTYDPPVGFSGTDTFTYAAHSTVGPGTATETVTITVANEIWFINNNAGACPGAPCDGRLSHPFISLAAFTAANLGNPGQPGDNDWIFVYESATDYTGPATLRNGQKFIGQDATASLATLTGFPAASGTDQLPVMNSGNGTFVNITGTNVNGINLLSGNTLRGFRVTDVGINGTKISGTSFGTLVVGNSGSPDVLLSGTGRALNLTTGTLAVTGGFVSVTTTSSATQGISLSGVADSDGAGAGSFSFGSTTVSGSTTQGILIGTTPADLNFGITSVTGGTNGVSFQSNASGTRTFATLSATGGANEAFLHGAGGGNVTVGATTLSSAGSAISVTLPLGSPNILTFGATTATTTAAGITAVSWSGIAGASMTFNSLGITRNNAIALGVGGGGTVNVTNGTGTISATTAAGPAIVASGVQLNANFSAINSSGGTNGVNLNNVTGTSNFGTGQLTGTISGATFQVVSGTASVTYSGHITQPAAAAMVSITDHATGTLTFQTGTLLASLGTGISLDNADGTYNFTGTTNLAGGNAHIDIIDGSAGTISFGAGTTITNPSGVAVNVDGSGVLNPVTGGITIAGSISKNSAGRLIDFNDYDTGTANISATLSCTASCDGIEVTNDALSSGTVNFTAATKTLTGAVTAVNLDNNDGGNVNFTGGGLDIDTTSGTGFNAINGGTVTITTGANLNTIDTTTGMGLNVTGTTIGAAGITLRRVTAGTAATGPANAIILNNTGALGFFTITGSANGTQGGDASGGTIQKTTSHGISLTNTRNISLTNMTIQNTSGSGIDGTTVTNFTFDNGTITGSGDAVFESNIAFNEDSVGNENNIDGTLTVTDSILNTAFDGGVDVRNGNGTISDAVITNNSVTSTNSTTTSKGSGIRLEFKGTASVVANLTKATITGNSVNKFPSSAGIKVLGGNANAAGPSATIGTPASGTNFINISTNAVAGESAAIRMGTNAIETALNGKGVGHIVINNNNPLQHVTGTGAALSAFGNVTLKGKITNNTIVANNGFNSSGIAAGADQTFGTTDVPILTLEISGNNVSAVQGNGILTGIKNTNGTASIKVLNNIIAAPTVGARPGIRADAGTNIGGNTNLCLEMSGNTSAGSGGFPGIGIREETTNTNTLNIVGLTPSPANPNQTEDYMGGQNPASALGAVGFSNDGLRSVRAIVLAGTSFSSCPTFTVQSEYSNPTTPTVARAWSPTELFNVASADELKPLSGDADTLTAATTREVSSSSVPSFLTPIASAWATSASETGARIAPTALAHSAEVGSQRSEVSDQKSEIRTHHAPSSKLETRNTTREEESGLRAHYASLSKLATRSATAAPAPMSGETVTANIGTLPAGGSVTITFQVTVNNPPNLTLLNPPRVENQGTVSGSNFANVLTDDPNVVGAADKTATRIDLFDTTTSLVSDINPSNDGDTVTFTATINETPVQGSVNPTGTVDFIDTSNGNAVICNDVAVAAASAQCQVSNLSAGSTHNIRADYSGDGNFDPSQSNLVAQVVNACVINPVVINTADSGAGSLRDAMATVCSAPNNNITFNIPIADPGFSGGVYTITLATQLVVGKTMNITGPNSVTNTNPIVVSGNNVTRVLSINAARTARIRNLTFSGGNSGALSGGGILNNGTLNLISSTVSGSTTTLHGGGIYNSGTGTLNVINSTFSGNSATTVASSAGGGIGSDGTLTITNSTVSGNTAGVGGGGVFVNSGTATIINSTVAENITTTNGGGVRADASVTLRNTIVANSTGPEDISGVFDTTNGFNLIENPGIVVVAANNITGQDPNLVPLVNNGGSTQTYALCTAAIVPHASCTGASPAIEAGSNANLPVDTFDLDGDANTAETLPVDQRGAGYPRTADSADADTTQTVDIGAFELHPSVENIGNQSTNEDTPINFNFNIGDDTGTLITGGGGSVTATSSNTTLVPNANLSVTDPAPPGGGARNLSITPASNQSGTTTITVTVTATNGRTATDTFDLNVTADNDNPTLTNNTGLTVNEASTGNVIDNTKLKVDDVDNTAAQLTFTVGTAPANGTLKNNGVGLSSGGTFTQTDIDGNLLTYDHNGSETTSDSFTFTVSDGAGGSIGSTAFNITVTAQNDQPTLGNNTGTTVNEGSTGNIIDSAKLSVNDVDNTPAQLTFTVGTAPANGTLKNNGVGLSSGGTFTQQDINNNLLTYDHNGTETTSDSFTFTLSDGAGGSIGSTAFNITVTAQNDAPTVTATGANLAYAEGDPATAVDTGLTVTDSDSANLTEASASITTNFQSGQDVLGWVDNNLADSITLDGSSTPQTIVLTGTDTPANYQAALRAVTYQNSSENPSTLTRTVTFTANDGTNTGQGTRNITVSAVNDSPTLTTNAGLTVINAGTGTIDNTKLKVDDVDNTAVQLTFTVGTATTNGTLKKGVATLSAGGTFTQADIDGNQITYTHNGTATTTDSFTFTVSDGSGGSIASTTFNITIGSPNMSISDAKVVEPVSPNTVDMVFIVSLAAPAGAAGASVNFTTNDGTATSGTCGNPGADYVLTSGQVNFAAGQQVKTINVPVCSDAVADDGETFTVTLSGAVDATIVDGTATGTITANTPGTVLISELRTSGPGGAGDDFVEIYNNSNSPLTVAASDASAGYGLYKMGADCNAAPVLIGVIPNGTVIPARGHYLFVGSAYSLTNYGGTGAAAGNLTLSSDIETDGNVGLFTTSEVTGISSVNRLDAVGFGANIGGACNLLREATTLPPIAGNATLEHSYFRKMCDWIAGSGCTVPGIPKDTNVNANDFWLADTTAAAITGRLGAPGPENLASPIRRDNTGINVVLLDGTVGSSAGANRDRKGTDPDYPASTFGTMTLRYRVTNNTGAPVTRLRYRVVDISTAIQPGGPTADLRALTSMIETGVGPVNDSVTCTAGGAGAPPCNVTVQATTLETPPNQTIGGGYNSTLSSGTITTGSPLPNNQSILINFKLGVQKTGTFRFYIIVEALP